MTDEREDNDRTPVKAEVPSTDVLDVTDAPFTFQTIKAISKTAMVPSQYRGKPYEMLACILTGRELGMGPMESLRRIDVIDGQPSPTGEWMVGQVHAAGHTIKAVKQTDTMCTVVGTRRHQGQVVETYEYTFTLADARQAGLVNKSNWKQYPKVMLYWRAASQMCRQYFSDVLGGLKYLPDELGDEDWAEPIPDVTGKGPVTVTGPAGVFVIDEDGELRVAERDEVIDLVEPDDDTADVVELDSKIKDKQWSELATLLGHPRPGAGTLKDIEQRVRQLYALVDAVGITHDPDIDWLHTHLEQQYGAKHWSDLRVKANMASFAERAFEWARDQASAYVHEHMTPEGEEDESDGSDDEGSDS